MSKPLTPPSTPRLSEVARHVVVPEGIVTTAWPRVVAKCEELGVSFDGWQHGLGTIALGKRRDGKYAATVGGVVLSIPRQVGKTFFVGMVIIALCLLFPGLTVLWTAHRTRTTSMTFATLKAMTSRKKIKPLMFEPRNTNGEQEIRFRNNSTIMFGAREQGFGRGFDEVDVEVFDEAQILTEKALEDMVPAANQSRQESGGLLFFMGTPPRPTDPGEEFTARRTKALSGKAKNMVYVEMSADEDADLDDKRQWAKANPSFPLRTPVESMERMRENLTDDESFKREALGIWTDPALQKGAFPPGIWRSNIADPDTVLLNAVACVDIRTGLKQSASIVLAGGSADGTDVVHVAYHEPESGQQIVDAVVGLLRARGMTSVVVDKYGENLHLIEPLEEAGLTVVQLNTTDMRAAAVAFSDALINGRLKHKSQEPLNAAVFGAGKRVTDSGFTWSWAKSTSDITPLRAATAAWWVYRSGISADYDVQQSFY